MPEREGSEDLVGSLAGGGRVGEGEEDVVLADVPFVADAGKGVRQAPPGTQKTTVLLPISELNAASRHALGAVAALAHASASRSSSGFCAFCQGGAVVPSLATRYRCAPISAMSSPGTSSMWMA